MDKNIYVAPDIYDIQVHFEGGFGVSDTARLDLDYEDEMYADD